MHDRLVSRRIDALHQCYLVCLDVLAMPGQCVIQDCGIIKSYYLSTSIDK